jgi:hypothetical protein
VKLFDTAHDVSRLKNFWNRLRSTAAMSCEV